MQDERKIIRKITGLRAGDHRAATTAQLKMDYALKLKEAERFAQSRSSDIVSRKHFVLARQPVARNMRPGFDIAYDVMRKRERALGFPGIIDLRLHLRESLL